MYVWGENETTPGRYIESVSPDRIPDLIDTSEPRTTSEVADALDVAQKTSYNKLVDHKERGEIRKNKPVVLR